MACALFQRCLVLSCRTKRPSAGKTAYWHERSLQGTAVHFREELCLGPWSISLVHSYSRSVKSTEKLVLTWHRLICSLSKLLVACFWSSSSLNCLILASCSIFSSVLCLSPRIRLSRRCTDCMLKSCRRDKVTQHKRLHTELSPQIYLNSRIYSSF